MSAKLELLIVVINYKTADLTIECLKTALPQLNDQRKIVVVDNFSNDGSAEIIESWIKDNAAEQINFIYSPTNSGFSGGNNQGVKSAEADYYLLLNSDTLLREGALDALLDQANANPKAGLYTPRLECEDGTPQISCFKFHSPISEFITVAHTGPITKALKKWDVPIDIQESNSFPQWSSFACIMVRKAVFDDVGLMDEGYFLYYEDVDFCRMALEKNWPTMNTPKAKVVHLRGGSSSVKSDAAQKKRVAKYVYESRTRYFKKHYGFLGFVTANILWHIGRSISLTREFLARKNSKAACEKQFIDIWTKTFN